MKKGITPIIAIVILLLIAVAIAGAAYTYITGYWTGLTAKAIELTSTTCNTSGIVTMNIRNFGQEIINTGSDISMSRSVVAGTGTALPNFAKFGDGGMTDFNGDIDPGKGGVLLDQCTATSATCQYTITTSGRAQLVTVTCT